MDEAYPLAYNQQALYFLSRLYPENPFYNYLDILHFEGNLDLNILIESFRYLVQRHEVFRTRIELTEKGPIQIVERDGELEVFTHKLNNTNSYSATDTANKIIKDARKPFVLNSNKKLRISIVKESNTRYSIGICAHHITIDKWSRNILLKELAQIYRQKVLKQEIELKPFSTSFKEYAKEQIEAKIENEKIDYWLSKIDTSEYLLDLPFDYKRLSFPTFNGTLYSEPLNIEHSKKLGNIAREKKVTPFVLFLSAYFILLKKYSRKSMINIGIPVTGKNSFDLEDVMGFFDETLVLTLFSDIANETYSDFIGRVKSIVFNAFDNKDVPLEMLIQKLKPNRVSGINPLFQVMFIYNKIEEVPSFGDDIEFTSEIPDMEVSKFDLTLFVNEHRNGFQFSFEYATDLFKQSTIEKFASHYQHILTQIAENPDIQLSDISLINNNDKKALLFNHNKTFVPLDPYQSVLELIQDKIRSIPDQIAISDEIQSITYRELGEKSEKIAFFLLNSDIRTNDIIGLYFGRSVNMIICMIGVLKAGGAYLPLDPVYPVNRIKYMIENANVSIILSESSQFPDNSIKLHSLQNILQHEYSDFEKPAIKRENFAYVIYTSGSTGNPKGVVVTHDNLLNSTLARFHFYNEQPENFLLFSSFSFDSSVAGIYWTLANGGKLVIAADRLEQDMDKLAAVLEIAKITHTLLLPSLYRAILTNIDPYQLRYIKNVVVAGEVCSSDLPEKHFQITNNAKLYNEYGPTEATVWATVSEIDKDSDGGITIGKPIANTKVYVLDTDLQPVPIGFTGEIFLAGLNISKGYLNDISETRSKFLKDPFADGGETMYRTGDLGRFCEDGQIEFIGRVDEQVKLRGFRIELSEIKNRVLNLPGILEAEVILKDQNEISNSSDDLIMNLKNMSNDEVESIISHIENLTDKEIDYLLNE